MARRFLQHAVGFPADGVALNVASGWVGAGAVDLHQGQGGAVGHHQVPGGVQQQDRHGGAHRIEIGEVGWRFSSSRLSS